MPDDAKQPTPLKMARAERDAARAEADLMRRVLLDLVRGRKPDATATAERPDGWTVTGDLYRANGADGGLVVVTDRDESGEVSGAYVQVFDLWTDSFRAHPSEHNVAEHLSRARWRIWHPVKTWTVRYNPRNTAQSEAVFEGVTADTAEEAMESAFQSSGHDDREAFFRDLEAVPA